MRTKSKNYLGWVAQQNCVLCGAPGVHCHHIREGQGMSQRASDFMAVPLCVSCHTGRLGIHGDRSLLRIYKKTELDLLADTIKLLYEERSR
jgi:hypothetical protein